MQLIISLPTDEDGIKQFNRAFAEVQATLIKKCIDDLNIDNVSKKKVVNNLLTTLQEHINERNEKNDRG